MEEKRFYGLKSDKCFKMVFGREGNEESLKAFTLSIIDNPELIANDDFNIRSPIVKSYKVTL